MKYGVATTVEALLDALALPLTTGPTPLYDASRVFLIATPDDTIESSPPGNLWVMMSMPELPSVDTRTTGGGSKTLVSNAQLVVELWNRYEADYQFVDAKSLKDATYGSLAKWRTIVKALHLYYPLNAAGDSIVIEPIRLLGWSTQKRTKTPFLKTIGRFDCQFVMDLT